MSQGTIIDRSGPRGPAWLLKYDAGKDAEGKRKIAYCTVRGTKREAQAKLRELLHAVDRGAHVDKSVITVAECVGSHLAGIQCGAKTRERNTELSRYITAQPIGGLLVQKL